jgi:hypothetical protein
MLNPLQVGATTLPGEFSVQVRRAGDTQVVDVGGSVGVLGAALLNSRLLSLLYDGAREVLVDLEGARPLARGALLATLLRFERHARQHGARLVVVAGPDTHPALDKAGARRWLTVACSREDALGALRSPRP